MKLHEENPFKIRSYSNAARQIERLSEPLSQMSEDAISKIPGVGSAIQKKIATICDSGQLPLLEKYISKTPEGIRHMMNIKGIGPKKLSVIWKKMGIETPGELLYACNEDRLTRYKGFGAKTQEKIRKAIEYYLQSLGYYLYQEALAFSEDFIKFKDKNWGKSNLFSPTGDLRRQCNTLSHISYVTDIPFATIKKKLPKDFQIKADQADRLILSKEAHPEVTLYQTSKENLGTTLFQTTGSKEFLASFINRHPQIEQQRFPSEEALFQATNQPYIIPALRESAALEDSEEIKVIQPTDIRGIIHSHSTWSDGKNTLKEMTVAAKEMGMEYLVISDHSKSAGYANGLKEDQILEQHQEIDQLNEILAPFKIFKSIESDILSDGSLDYDDELLETFDLVIASIHSNLNMQEEQATERLLKAINNPFTTILGHPTGRLLLSRKGYPIQHKKVIDACVKNNVVIEINAHPRRLDIDWQFIPYAIKQGALLSIDPDAHSIEGLSYTKYGVWSAQKGGLTAEKNLSSFSLQAFEKFLEDKCS